MKKRVCETCFFFQEAGFAKNGWCNHPQRKQSSDVKIVVRRGELPCRNGWSQDLWLAAGDGAAADFVIDPAPAIRPEPPASVEEVTFLVNSRRDQSPTPEPSVSAGPVDLVVGESPSVMPPKPAKPAQQGPSLLHQDPRSAILKAREQYKARKQAEARGAEFGQQLLERAAAEPAAPVDDHAVNVRMSNATTFERTPPRRHEEPPVRLSEIPRAFPTMTTFPDDEVRFSTVPEPVANVPLPRVRPEPLTRPIPPAPAIDDVPLATTRERVVLSSETTRVEFPADDEWTRDPGDQVETQTDVWIEPDPVSDVPRRRWLRGRGAPGRAATRAMDGHDLAFGEEVEQAAWLERPEPAPLVEPRVADNDRDNAFIPAAFADTEILESPDPAYDDRDDDVVVPLYADVAESVSSIDIAPGVTRHCRTCRDFRPADNGERGWCTNSWAFSHRRMVDADELPCVTSVGLWWLPHDDIWLTIADASAHGEPTPLVDQWLSHAAAMQDDVAEPRRRRRS